MNEESLVSEVNNTVVTGVWRDVSVTAGVSTGVQTPDVIFPSTSSSNLRHQYKRTSCRVTKQLVYFLPSVTRER